MDSNKNLRMLFLVPLLALVIFAPLAQNVSAHSFFDKKLLLNSKADPALRTALGHGLPEDKTRISVVLVFSHKPSPPELEALASLGSLRTFTGHVATMNLPRESLQRLATLDFVERISLPREMRSQLDVSVPEILANQVWDNIQYSQSTVIRDANGNPVDGTGVVVGIVDSGIDYLHQDFYFKNGTSKILYIWDQSVDGRSPDGFGYGNECTTLDIRIKACSEYDGGSPGQETGHGTAVAAVAASTGQATSLLESCMRYDGTDWSDETADCNNSDGRAFTLLANAAESRYFGNREKFSRIFFSIATTGEHGATTWEYSKGNGNWGTVTTFSDGTEGFKQSGSVVFTRSPQTVFPTDWATDTINGVGNTYWIRLRAASVAKPATIYHVQANPPYFGVAPSASIIAVKLKDGKEDHVLDGINYVVRKARELGRPVIINHSIGDSLGSHDGTESLDLAMTDFAEDGIPIVVAAGNARDKNLHVSGKLSAGQSVTVLWYVGENETSSYVDLWYSTSDSFAISVKTPSGLKLAGPTPESGVSTPDGNVVLLQDMRATGKEWWINVTSVTGKPLQSLHPPYSLNPWSFTLTGLTVSGGKWDAWTEWGNFTISENGAGSPYIIDPTDTIDTPGTATGVITVGAYMTRYRWKAGCSACLTYGSWVTNISPTVGDLTYSSGAGPTRDGRMKPEITAPGGNIAAARALTSQSRQSDPDNYHQMWRGTSFATAHVTGVIALMLQMNPYLSPSQIKSILTENARQDEFTGQIDKRVGSPLWGWGKVDALKSTKDAPKLYSIRLEILSIGGSFAAGLSLDGENILTIPLNQTKVVGLQFRRDGNHTIELTPAFQVGPGTRYVVSGTPWTFSSGGTRTFEYRLQYFLKVVTPYGYATGTGWYDANSTAIVTVIPTEVPGYRFLGWSGSASSNSPTVQLTMNSSKEIVAQWEAPMLGSPVVASLVVVMIVAIGIVSLAVVVKLKRSRHTSSLDAY